MKNDEEQAKKAIEAYQRLGTISGAARALDVHRDVIRRHLRAVGLYDERPMYAGRISPMEVGSRALPKKGKVKRYFLTSAQNNTLVAPKVWDTLLTVVEHYDAELLVGTFTYNKASYGPKAAKRGRGPTAADKEDLWYDPEVEPFILDEPVLLAPGLEWRGEMNILPTAQRPLQDLESYTGRHSGIFPHVKLAMASVASGKHEPTKFNYTTGTATKRNYIQKKAGLKADFHHVYGGLLVEVDSAGTWFVRQITVDRTGVAYDLDLKFESSGEVTSGHKAASITWGDIHVASIDRGIAQLCWGKDGMMELLQPQYQLMHDILDFRARNGHTAKKNLIHDRFAAYIQGHDSVEEELKGVASFLNETSRPDCKTVVVDSNHDAFMMEWLRIGDYKQDPVNAIYFLETQLHVYRSIAADPEQPVNILRWAIERINSLQTNVQFLDEDESFILLGIEHGMHGHRGPNGARGTAGNLAKMGRRINRGHEHAAGIHDGVYTGGLTGKNDQGYNKGPGAWSASHTVVYPNGKRAIYTMFGGKWRA